MNNFRLKVDQRVLSSLKGYKRKDRFRELMTLERHFTSAGIYIPENCLKSRLTDVVERFGKRLTKLELESEILTAHEMLRLLKVIPELQELYLSLGNPEDCTEDFQGSVQLKKLEKLTLVDDSRVLRFIKAPKLVYLEVEGKNFNQQIFESFLKACPHLETLKAGFEITTSDFPFQLKALSCSQTFINCNEIMKNFFLSQAKSLKTLEASCADSEFLEMVLTNFKHLNILKSQFEYFDAPQDFYRKLKPLPLLTEVVSYGYFSSATAIRAVLGICPELVTLGCFTDEDVPNHLDFIANTNEKLEFLTVSTIRATTNARFPCLKTLTMERIQDEDHLTAFLKANPTIETLCIREVYEFKLTRQTLDILMNKTGLKHVKINESDEFTVDTVYNKIKKKFGNWKTLELSYYHFEFPDNPADWKPSRRLSDYKMDFVDFF